MKATSVLYLNIYMTYEKNPIVMKEWNRGILFHQYHSSSSRPFFTHVIFYIPFKLELHAEQMAFTNNFVYNQRWQSYGHLFLFMFVFSQLMVKEKISLSPLWIFCARMLSWRMAQRYLEMLAKFYII